MPERIRMLAKKVYLGKEENESTWNEDQQEVEVLIDLGLCRACSRVELKLSYQKCGRWYMECWLFWQRLLVTCMPARRWVDEKSRKWAVGILQDTTGYNWLQSIDKGLSKWTRIMSEIVLQKMTMNPRFYWWQ